MISTLMQEIDKKRMEGTIVRKADKMSLTKGIIHCN